MIEAVKMPSMGMTMNEGTLVKWHVDSGDSVQEGQVLLEIESEKTVAEIEAPRGGVFRLRVASEGDVVPVDGLLGLITDEATSDADIKAFLAETGLGDASAAVDASEAEAEASPQAAPEQQPAAGGRIIATPRVRKRAREMKVELALVRGTGKDGRIEIADVEAFARQQQGSVQPRPAAAPAPLPAPSGEVSHSAFGPVEKRPLSRIRKLTGAYLHRAWITIPHVTSHDEANITELEELRQRVSQTPRVRGAKLTLLPFLVKASVAALKQFPEFNSSLQEDDTLVLKKYYNIGIAVDTPTGLFVPVVKDADKKDLVTIAEEIAQLSAKGRAGKLTQADMEGGSFSISSLGGVGGAYFTPIINAPEVAIMGVTRATWQQRSPDGRFWAPQLMLPLSLSWDHRVVDGANAARFNLAFADALAGGAAFLPRAH